MEYLSKFDEKGQRLASYPIDETVTKEFRAELEKDGFIEISEEEWHYYIGNMGYGDNGTGYIRDPETGKPVSAPPYVQTKAEKANNIAREYSDAADRLNKDILLAMVDGDDELIESLKEEKDALLTDYQSKLEMLEV